MTLVTEVVDPIEIRKLRSLFETSQWRARFETGR